MTKTWRKWGNLKEEHSKQKQPQGGSKPSILEQHHNMYLKTSTKKVTLEWCLCLPVMETMILPTLLWLFEPRMSSFFLRFSVHSSETKCNNLISCCYVWGLSISLLPWSPLQLLCRGEKSLPSPWGFLTIFMQFALNGMVKKKKTSWA